METDLSASSPVSASPENKNIHGPRRIIVERRVIVERRIFRVFLTLELETGTNQFLADARVEFSV